MTKCNVVVFFFRETWFKLSWVPTVKLIWKRLLIILIMGHKRQNNYPILTTQCHNWSETYTFNRNTGSSCFNCQKPSKYSNLSRHLWCIDTVNIDTHAWHMKHCTSNIHNQSGWKLSQRLSQSHCNKLNKTEMTTLTHKAKTDLGWPRPYPIFGGTALFARGPSEESWPWWTGPAAPAELWEGKPGDRRRARGEWEQMWD